MVSKCEHLTTVMITADTAIKQKYARQKNKFVFRRFRTFDVMMPRCLPLMADMIH